MLAFFNNELNCILFALPSMRLHCFIIFNTYIINKIINYYLSLLINDSHPAYLRKQKFERGSVIHKTRKLRGSFILKWKESFMVGVTTCGYNYKYHLHITLFVIMGWIAV